MGKSSLRVRVSESLRAEGYTCIVMDMFDLCVSEMSEEDFYGAFVYSLIGSCELSVDDDWWYTRNYIPIKLRLIRFIEDVLLQQVRNDIVVFIDEIDHLLNYKFKDDFFILIRSLFNKRADYSQYNRLTFVLLGVATPSDLISVMSQHRTPFNISIHEIELTGFQPNQLEPLEQGLLERVSNPKTVLKEIIDRSGGQPFLTQWLCELILQHPIEVEEGREAEWIEGVVRLRVIENWKINDRQEHFRTIANRLRSNDRYAIRLLDIYKQILKYGEVESDDSYEQMQLQLSGLVVKRIGKLKVYNRIYKAIFDQSWVENTLSSIRPYDVQFTEWFASNCQDESKLLQGKILQDTLIWADKRSLSTQDYQFLTASQQLSSATESARFSKFKRIIQLIFILVVLGSLLSTVANLIIGNSAYRRQAEVWTAFELEKQAINALQQFRAGGQEIEALRSAIKAGQDLQSMAPNTRSLADYPTTVPIKALQEILRNIREVNQFKIPEGWLNSAFSQDGKYFATTDGENSVLIWDHSGAQVSQLAHAKAFALSFSSDGRTIATASLDGVIKIWDTLSGKLISQLKQGNAVATMAFSPEGDSLAVSTLNGQFGIWNLSRQTFILLSGATEQFVAMGFSQDGNRLTSVEKNGTVRTWDKAGRLISQWQTVREFDSPPVTSLSVDGNYLTSAGAENSVQIRDSSGRLVSQLKVFWGDISSMSFSTDGQQLVTVENGAIRFWQLSGQKLIEFKGSQDAVRNLSFNSATQILVTAEWDGTVTVWSLNRYFKQRKGDAQNEVDPQLDELLREGCTWLEDYFATHPDALKELQICERAR